MNVYLSSLSRTKEKERRYETFLFFCITESVEYIMARRCISLLFTLLIFHQHYAYDFRYHNYLEMTAFLHNIAAQYPTRASLVKIGQSGGGMAIENSLCQSISFLSLQGELCGPWL